MENNLIINLCDDRIITLSTNTPDMEEMIKAIVENRDTIDPEKITVEVNNAPDFDIIGFEKFIKEVARKYLKLIRLETIDYRNKLETIEK